VSEADLMRMQMSENVGRAGDAAAFVYFTLKSR